MQLTAQQIDNEVRFWLAQDREHMLFLELGFEDPILKNAARVLKHAYDLAFSHGDLNAAMHIVQASQALKRQALHAAERGLNGWTGWLYPSLLEHMFLEMLMMQRSIAPGGVSARETLCWVNHHNADVAALTAHLLDPSEAQLEAAARQQHQQLRTLEAAACPTPGVTTLPVAPMALPQLAQNTTELARQLDAFSGSPQVAAALSVLNPLMVAHERREGQHALQHIQALTNDEAAPRPAV